jgi:hypothetical protein
MKARGGTAGVTSKIFNIDQTIPGSGVLASFYGYDMLYFFLISLTILWLYVHSTSQPMLFVKL